MAGSLHIVLASVGTDGDIFPYVGLGRVLRERGHRVTLVASEHYAPLAKGHGLSFRELHSEADNTELFSHPDFWHPIKTATLTAAWGLKRIESQYALLRDVCRNSSSVLVANPGILAAMLVHEKQGVPWANLVLQPWFIPSVDAPSVMLGLPVPRKAPRPVIRLYWRLIDAVVDLLVGRRLNDLRASVGLPRIRRIFKHWLSPQLIIGAFPEWYGRPQPDWPRQMKLVGFPMFDGACDIELAPELAKFCQAGSAPIALTFGTGMMQARQLFTETVSACRLLGRRAIALTKYRNQLPDPLPADVRHCSFAPFRKLFPLCGAVIHHGGIGTTSEALAAGIPQIILPIAFDQADNAERVKRLGAGDFVLARRATSAQIARLLDSFLQPEKGVTLPLSVRERLASNDGLQKAADLIEGMARLKAKVPETA